MGDGRAVVVLLVSPLGKVWRAELRRAGGAGGGSSWQLGADGDPSSPRFGRSAAWDASWYSLKTCGSVSISLGLFQLSILVKAYPNLLETERLCCCCCCCSILVKMHYKIISIKSVSISIKSVSKSLVHN